MAQPEYDEEDDDFVGGKPMTLLEHLIELRNRLVVAAIALMVATIAASLAALLLTVVPAACGGGGAEPDAPADGAAATLVLDFQPSAVHAGIYAALEALSTRRILAASRAAGVAERVRVAVGIRRRRKRGLALGVQAARGFAPSFLPYTDPALHIRLGAIFTASLRADPRDDGSADRGDALYRWITAPLRGKYT